MTETRESLTRTFCALCHAAMGVASEPACEEVVVVLSQKIERTARALRDLRPKAVLAPGPYAAKPDGECVCGHNGTSHGRVSCLGVPEEGSPHKTCPCPEYRPLPF